MAIHACWTEEPRAGGHVLTPVLCFPVLLCCLNYTSALSTIGLPLLPCLLTLVQYEVLLKKKKKATCLKETSCFIFHPILEEEGDDKKGHNAIMGVWSQLWLRSGAVWPV